MTRVPFASLRDDDRIARLALDDTEAAEPLEPVANRVLSDPRVGERSPEQPQPSATSNAVTLRVSRLNSTPIRWIGSPSPRYLSA